MHVKVVVESLYIELKGSQGLRTSLFKERGNY
jgi:hypothetical protein